MAKFQFRLATLLKLREAARDERRMHLAEAYQAEEKLAEHQHELKDQLAALRAQYADASAPGSVQIDALVEHQRFELVLKAQQQVVEQQGKLLDGEIERRRQALMQADREVRVLEKLREKQSERHRHDEAIAEIKQLDEIAGRPKGNMGP